MKRFIIQMSTLFLFVIFAVSCGDKKESTATAEATKGTKKAEDVKDNVAELLAGSTSKKWHIARQTDASGDKVKTTSEEKDETLSFFNDGRFSITDAEQTSTGTWATEGTHTLIMHFEGKDVSENFTIMDLSKEKIVLQAADGSEMTLKED